MPRVPVDGAAVNVETAGSGQPLVLLHGFTGSAATWAPHLDSLVTRYQMVAIDLLGHGESDAPDDPRRYGVAHAVEDVVAVLDALAIRRATILGYSMGGRVALAVAIAAPERVSGLILESASTGLRDPQGRHERAEHDAALADAIERDGIEAFIDRWERQPLFATQAALPEAVRARNRAQRLQNRAAGLANSLRGLGQGVMPPMHDFLADVRVRTLVMAGALDPHYVEAGREISAALGRGWLEVVPGAGHAVHLEQPAAFQRLVVEFPD